ncbi:unnamed protein product [Cuscuta campestris]|uniref:Uncharacterized protein n=1 Tax=Cuscuta campestris TaxID=132261 RepID=A0A484M3Y8_9ASTE|nr:unnamed protein product [Cuscuta campestris]
MAENSVDSGYGLIFRGPDVGAGREMERRRSSHLQQASLESHGLFRLTHTEVAAETQSRYSLLLYGASQWRR